MANQSNTFGAVSVSGGFPFLGNQFNGNVSIAGLGRDDTDGLQCLSLLKTVNPEDERRRILVVKDQLVTESYSWILEDENFRSWLHEDTHHLLWIKGGPGKGKTMMMAGLVDVLSEARNSEGPVALSYFFCQNSEDELRKATSILKGLIYMLAFRERSLVHHLKTKYQADGEEVFTGPRALFTLWHVLEDMLSDFHGAKVYLLVDGLDECDDPEFDDFLRLLSGYNVTTPGKVKWLVTSRPLPRIQDIIGPAQDRSRISLEIEAQHVSQGVETFINEKVNHLKLKKHWSPQTAQKVHSYLQSNAEGTFLWVALVCQRLQGFPSWKVENELTNLASLRRGLDPFYDRMMQVVRDEIPDYADLCMRILRTTTLAYRPLRLPELGTVVTLPHELQRDDSLNLDSLKDLIERCGSFILVHEDTIYLVHQSAKDYLTGESGSRNFHLDQLQEHISIADKCLDTLNLCLKDHQFLDPTSFSKQELDEDELRLLSRIAYACSCWIHHTLESIAQTTFKDQIPNQRNICNLLESRLISWVHALGSLKEVTACVAMIKALLDIQGFESTDLFHMMQDTYRFLLQNRHIVEESPNQVYTSALLFAPKSSWIRKNYQSHIPKWIRLRTKLNDTWDACLVTLVGHSEVVKRVTFSSDGSLLASKSKDCTRLWETKTGQCRGIVSHDSDCEQLAFSPDDRVLVTGLEKGPALLDTTTGSQQLLSVGVTSEVRGCLFAPNGQILASFARDYVRLWDISTRENREVFVLQETDSAKMGFRGMAFQGDSKRVLIANSSTVEVWDLETSNIVATFRMHYYDVTSIQISPDNRLLLSACSESIWIWIQSTAKPVRRLNFLGTGEAVDAKFSPDGSLILSTHGRYGPSLILWESSTGNKLHDFYISLHKAMFSPDSTVMVTVSYQEIKAWDTTTGDEIAKFQGLNTEDQESAVSKCLKDGNLFAHTTGSKLKIWEARTGTFVGTLEGHSDLITALEFSPAGRLIASGSRDNTVKLWNLNQSTSSQATFRDGDSAIENVTVSLDGTLAASVSRRGGIHLWDLQSGLYTTLLHDNLSPWFSDSSCSTEVIISPDSSLLAACSGAYGVRIWETGNGVLRYESTGFRDSRRIAFSPNSHLLNIEFDNGDIMLLENHAGDIKDVQKPSHAESTKLQVSPDGRFSVSVERIFGTVFLWKLPKDSGDRKFKFILGRSGGVATFSPDSKLVALVSNEGSISVWETETGAFHGLPGDMLSCTNVVSFSHDNRFIAYTFGDGYSLGLLELSNGLSRELDLNGADFTSLLAFSPDASMVAVVSGRAILLCETTSGSLIRRLELHPTRISDMTFLPHRNILIAGHEDHILLFWDTNDYDLLFSIYTPDCPPRLSLDNKRKFLWTGNHGLFLDDLLQPCEKPASAISVEGDWVLFNGERIFWLPTEFRPTILSGYTRFCSKTSWDSSRNALAIGHLSGNVTTVQFDI